jgi:hypothetical protein
VKVKVKGERGSSKDGRGGWRGEEEEGGEIHNVSDDWRTGVTTDY